MSEILPALQAVLHADDVKAVNVAHLADVAHFNEHNSVPAVGHSHTGFENHVEPCLTSWFPLMRPVGHLAEVRADIPNVIRSQQDDNGTRVCHSSCHDVTGVGRPAACGLGGITPLDHLQVQGLKEGDKRIARTVVTTVHEEDTTTAIT